MPFFARGTLASLSSRSIAAAIICLGGLVLLGWYTENPALIQVNPAFVPMQYNTALGFILCGLGLGASSMDYPRIQRGLGSAAALLGLATLIQYLFSIDLGIDQLFMEHYIDVKSSHPGRMAPNTALCFTLSGLALALPERTQKQGLPMALTATLGAMVFALGIVAFGGYATGVETAYGWGALTKMAVHTSLGFVVMGPGILLIAIDNYRKSHAGTLPPWLPWVTAFGGATITLAVWQAAHYYEQLLMEQVGTSAGTVEDETLLVLGILATVSSSLWLKARTSSIQKDEGQTTNFATVAVLSLGFALALGLHQILDGIYKESVLVRFESAVTTRLNSIERGLHSYTDALYDIRSVYESSQVVDRKEFSVLAKRDLETLPGILGLFWVPRITAEERQNFEKAQAEWRQAPIYIWEWGNDLNQIEAPERGVYYPVEMFEPTSRNLPTHGFNIGSFRPSLDRAMEAAKANTLMARGSLDDPRYGSRTYGEMLYLPVYTNGMPLDTAEERLAALKGFLGAEINLDAVIDAIISSETLPAGIDLEFTDREVDTGKARTFIHSSRIATDPPPANPLQRTLPFNIGGHNWMVTATAANSPRYETWSSSNLVLPLFILLFAFVLAGYLRRSALREAERSNLLKEIASREKHFSALVQTIPGAAYSSRLDENRSLGFASVEIETLTGYAPASYEEGLVDLGQFTHPEDRALVRGEIESAVEQKKPYAIEYRMVHRDGSERWVYDNGAALYNDTGQPEELHGTIIDITDRKHSEARFKGLLESAPDGMVIVDESGQISFINEQTKTMFGYSTAELVGEQIEVLLPERLRAAHPQHRTDYFAHPSVRSMGSGQDLAALTKSGEEIPVEISLSPLQTSSGLLVSAAIRDISYRKQMENEIIQARDRAEEATRAKSEFLANMSHEIRTPMNSIIGMSHLALQTDLTTKQRNYVEKTHRSAESLLKIINDILDYSKIEAGKLELESIPFGLDHVLHNLVNILGLQAEDKGLELLFDIPTDLPREFIGDALRLEQVLLNLGSNAIKFTEHGEVVIAIKPVELTEGQVTLEFSVRDTGIGMSRAEQERLFQPFSQADSSTTRKFGGTGLGLTICRRIVEVMGGEISVSSQEGQGSCFTFFVGFERNLSTTQPDRVPPPDISGSKVLVVDDNRTSREILETILSSFGFKCHSCASGAQALDLIEQAGEATPFNLVILDWKMPGMDGIETARRIQDTSSRHSPTCVMVTAYGSEEAAEVAEGVDIKAFMTKPVTPSSLLDSIMSALGKAQGDSEHPGRKTAASSAWLDALQGARVLLVEDNELNQELAIDLLTLNGIQVNLATNGREALEMLEGAQYDGVLMDCQMPVMDGYTATRKIREDSRFADLPILAMTANAMGGDREKALAAGMNDHISKPVDPELMFRCMAQWIAPTRHRQETAAAQVAETEPADSPLQLPEMPGIDQEKGLFYTQNRLDLYCRMLKKFAQQYGPFEQEMRLALQDPEPETAIRYAHSLKSGAGAIGATDVAQQAADLEQACRGGQEQAIEDLGGAINTSLSRLIPGVETALAAHESATQTGSTPGSGSSRVALAERLKRIRELLQASDIDAIDLLKQLLREDLDPAMSRELDEIHKLAAEFEFDQALHALQHTLSPG